MTKPIHQDLDTAFVNLPALIRYLCRRGFEGNIHIEMSAYEADVFISGGDELEVQERDLVTGRFSEGEEAMQRLLIRAREAGGVISVHQKVTATVSAESFKGLRPEPQIPIVQARASAIVENLPVATMTAQPVAEAIQAQQESKPVFTELVGHLNQPVQQPFVPSPQSHEWQDLLELTGELLSTIDRSLASANLDFKAAFAKASLELTNDYLFLRSVKYSSSGLSVTERPDPNIFVSGITDILRRVMHRLGANPQFMDLHQRTVERLVDLVHRNKERCDAYKVTAPIYRVIGIHA